MKFNPTRIAYIILIVATVVWLFTYSFSKKDAEEIAKSEPNKPATERIRDASDKPDDQNDLNSVREPMAVWNSTPYTPEQIADIEAKIAAMFPPAPEIDVERITEFGSWAERYLAATPEQRAEMEKEGIAMAAARRPEFLKMIKSDPQRALEMAVPRVVRQDLPVSITKLLEQPVSAKGDLDVIWGKVAPGITPPKQPLVIRSFQVGDMFYKPYVYGQLAYLNSRKGIPLRGVELDGELAVAENAVRRLENGERIPKGAKVEETCPVSGNTTESVSEGEAVTEATPTVEIAERIITLCSSFHTQFLEENYRSYIQGAGSGGGGFFIDNYPGTGSKSIGNLRCLYIRVTYPDQMQQPISEELAYSDMRDNARFYLENSYGKLTQTTSVTPTLVLPHTLRWYYDYHSQSADPANSQVAFQQIHTDSRAAAKAAGYDTANFDCILVRVNQGPRLEGISWGGGNTVWLTWNGMDVINHEVGHSLGRNHANYWDTTPPTGDGTPYGFGANAEYGNIFDNMGSGGGFAAHYNSVSKQALGWLPSSYVHTQLINGSYRVYAYDQSRLEEGKRYALNIAKDTGRTYNLEYHPAMGNYLTDAAVLIYSGLGTNCGHLIDTTQGTIPGKNDAGIPVGRTYSDPEADLHFTTLSVNDTVPSSIDVMVNKGPFPGNVAPTASFTASATTITAGSSVTFTATASDTNGDNLAYFWEFDDGLTGTNTSTYTRTFATTGQYTAMLTVSDMKGGSVRRTTVINVGSHGKQTISGTVTAGGVGLQGVYVSGGGKGCYTNADGTFTLSGQTGSPSLTATLAGYTFTNPLVVAAGSTTANWSATTGTLVTLAKVADTAEGGTNGTFRFTRTGSTTAALDVYVNPPGGTATMTTDYTMSPSPSTSGTYRIFTIPAGATQLNVTVTPANDTTAEGPETITMCVAGSGTAGSYYASGNNSIAMTIADNDTTLPQVSVTAPDRYAMEAPSGDNGTFRFTRTGATTSSLALTVAWSGTATNGSDYNTLSTTVTIPAGQSFVDVSMVPINDTVIEIPETAIVTIGTNAAYLLDTGATSATVTTSDDDAPVLTVSALDPIATEGGADTGVFMLTRTGSTAAPLTVYYGLRGVAQHGTDYAWLTGEVNIPAGAASAPVVIYAFDDDMAEPTETMILAVTTFNNSYNIGTNYEATVQIVDNADTPLIDVRAGVSGSSGVSYANQAVGTAGTEGGSNPTFIIHSVGHGSGNVTVNYTVSGTATSGSDYTALTGTVSIPIEGVNDTTITVPIINDAIAEPTETLVLTLTPSPNYRFYNDGSATVSIFDNENNDRVSVSQGLSTPTETGTAGKIAFRRTKTTGALTVNYTLTGTATNGSDYNTLSGSVTIPDGSRSAEITVTPINDTAAEGTETITVNVASGAGYDVDIPGAATLEIVDNETPSVTVGFQSATLTTDELPGLLGQYRDLPVVLSAASANTITVNYYANGGNSLGDDVDWAFVDAANGNKIIPGGTLTFAPGVMSQNVRIMIKNDGYAELNETAIIQLGGAYNAGLTATKDKQTITINDASAPRYVRMLIPSSTRYEADGSEPMLQVILDRAAGASPITVNYAATGTATSGSDYTLTGTSLTFNTGELIKSIPLTLLTDAVNESAETIVISLSSPSGASLTGPATHAITLLDSSAPVVATQYVNAASSQATNTLITTATATVASGRSVSSWSILSGNTGNAFAINGTNGQITLAIPSALPNPGGIQLIVRVTDNTGATGTGAINIICNAAANPVVEARWVGEEAYLYEDWSGIKSYTGNLATLTPGQNSGNDFSRRLTAYLKPTTTGNYTFYIAGDRDCRLYLSTDGYESRKVKIAEVVGASNSIYQAWDTYLSQKSVSIPLVAGKVYWIEAQHFDNSGNDSVSVAWEGPGITRTPIPGSVLVPTAPGVSFNEPQGNGVVNTAPTISNITDRSTGINTSTGAIAFTIGDTETPTGSLVLSGSSSNLTLIPNSNIVFGGSGANRTVTVTPAAGQTGTVTINIMVSDGALTATDSFLLAVGSSQIIAFKNATSSGAESVTPANIQIEMLPANPSGSVSVDYALTGGTATSGSDFTFTNGTLVFAPNETLKTVPITVVNDALGESNETVVLTLGNAIGAVIGTNANHTYTIANDDTDISIVATDAAATEAGADTGTFTLTRAGSSTGTLTVNLTTSGTATNSTDYGTLPTTVTFNAGETVKTLTVTPVNDLVVEGSDTVTLTVATGVGYTVGSPSSATVTIADDDVDISIAATTATTTEQSATAGVFTVTRTGVTTGTTVVNLTVSGTATPTTDYTAIASTLTFTAGQTSKTVSVAVNGITDTVYEDSETVTLTVASGTGYQPASPTSATVTIADNDKPTISVAGTATLSETPTPGALLTFTRTGWTGNSQNITVTITGTATSITDYTALPTTVTFPANSATTTLTVTPVDDQDFEIDETVIVTIAANAAYTVAGTPNNAATVTISNNDKPTVTVAVTDATCLEAASDDGVFTLTRTGTTAATLTVNYTISGTSTNSTDYAALTGTVTFAAASSTATVAINPTDDADYETTETAILTINTDPAYIVGASSSASISLVDNDKPTISIAGTATLSETPTPGALLTFTRTGWTGASQNITVTITGTATSITDYTALPTTVTFPANSATTTLTVAPVGDLDFEVDETVIVTIAANAAYTVAGTPNNAATVTISNNDKPTVTVAATDAAAAEATTANPGAFTLTRTGTTVATLTTTYTLSGTATNGTDYTTLTGSVTFAAGSATAAVTVTVTNDAEYENSEDVTLTLNSDPAYILGTGTTASVTITDNDLPTISVAGTATLSETPTPGALLTFTRTGWTGNSQNITVTITGTATSVTDYAALPTTVTFPANSATTTLTVAPVGDLDFEVDETVIVTIATNAAYTVAGTPNNAATVTISNNDKPTVTVAATDAAAAEATTANPGAFTLTRTGTTVAALTTTYTLSGTATNGTDYTTLTGSVTFAAGSATAAVTVTVTNDAEYENTEDVTLTLNSDPAYILGTGNTASVTITDNDLPTISVAGTATLSETPTPGALLTFTRTGWTGASQNITVTITGTATSVTDYAALPTTVTFPANSATTTLTVAPVGDLDFEVDETVIVTIAANAAYTVAATPNNAATVTISNNDKPTVTVAATDAAAAEATTANPGAFTLTRTGTTVAALTTTYTLSGTATNGTDYTTLTGSVTFAAGSATAAVTVTITNDTDYEGSEDVTLTLNSDPAYLLGASTTASVTITDNDLPIVSISTSSTSAFEGGTAPVLTFTRTGITSLGPLTVLYLPTGTATVGSDYAAMSATITIPQGQSSATLNTDILQDNVTEAPETLIVTISASAAYTVAASPANAANLTIVDDTEAVVVNISSADATASEPAKGDGVATYTINRSGSTSAALSVNIMATGTGTEGVDYSALPSTVTIPAGQTSATFTLTPTDDLEAEVDETVIVNLLGGSGYTVGATPNFTLNLYDDEATQVRVEVTDAKCLEAATADAGTFTLRRLGNRTAALTVNYTVPQTGKFATSGTDYSALTGTANMAAGGTSVTVTVSPINDTATEGTETVTLTLATGTGYAINAQNTGIIEIRDDETVDVNLSVSDLNCAEQATTDTGAFRITRSATAATSLTVTYTITGTATNGTDYTTLTGTATIPANATTVDITVTPTNDGVLEGIESVIMTLTGAGTTYDIGDSRAQTLMIKDDDAPNITVTASDAAASEGDGNPVNNGQYTFTASFAPISDLTIKYTITGGTNGADYNYLPGTIILSAGQTSVNLPLVPIDDQLPENSENVGVAITYGTGYNVPSVTAVNVTIAASDTPTASIVAFDPNATENSTDTGRYIVTLSKAVTGNTNVTYTVSGTATSASDYTALTGTATVSTGNNSAIITVTPVNDALTEGPESVTLTLTSSASYTIGAASVASVTIADDEAAATPLAGWKQSSFGTDWNDPAIAGDSVDYDLDGMANLIEYALGSDPATQNSQEVQSTTNTGSLKLSFNRAVASNDVTIIVQATDNLTGAWTDIASSINGGVTTSLVPGVTVTETGSGSTRSVSVTDLYTTNDPAHPRRFMRIRVNP